MEQKNYGKTIELFFVNGTSDGIVTAELSNWSGRSVKIPRINVKDYDRGGICNVGVYLLYCVEDDGSEKIYVGEAENVSDRLKQHIRDYQSGKESFYWNQAVVFTDDRLDKAEIRYIEYKLADIISSNDKTKLLTKSTYKNTALKDSQIAKAEEFIDNIKTLLGALGLKTLNEVPKATAETIYFYCKGADSSATGFLSNEGFTVMKGSKVSSKTANSFKGAAYYKLREKLIEDQVIVNGEFTKDYEFKAPSAASSVVLGRASNGKDKWKTQNGVKFADIKLEV